MACEMQQIVGLCQEPESTECLEVELPLTLRLRRSWSAGDLWDLRKASEDECVSYPDCGDFVDIEPDPLTKFIDDSASTCDYDDASSMCDETSICTESVSTRLDWADESEALESPLLRARSFDIFPGQWTSTLEKLDESTSLTQNPKGDLVESVKILQRANPEVWFQYTTEYGKNIRDPRKHTVQFLKDFLVACGKSDVPPGQLDAISGVVAAPPGQLHTPPGKMSAFPSKCADSSRQRRIDRKYRRLRLREQDVSRTA